MKKRHFFDNSYLARIGISVSASVLAVALLFYLGYHLSGNLKDGISTEFARAVSFADNVECVGYILKDETPISSAYSSTSLSPVIGNGKRVSAGGKVADSYTAASDAVTEKLRLLEEQIDFYEECRDTHATIGDSGALKREIGADILSLRRYAEKGTFKNAYGIKREMLMSISTLGVMTGKVTDFDTKISALNAEAQSLRSSLGNLAGSVYAPSAGYYFAECDGYESLLSSKGLDSLTYSGLSDLLSAAEAHTPTDTSGKAGKIMHSFKWYVACPMSSTESARLKVGASYTVTLGNNEASPLTMEVYSILSNATGSIAVFECTTVDGELDYTRLQSVSVTVDTVDCFAVPVSAVRYYDDMRGVYILNKTTVDFRRISVFDERNGFYLCYDEDPTAKEELPDGEVPETETADTEAESSPYHPYLRENDIIITGGTGLYVGMVYNNKG